jgi:hypothetical protein
MAEDPKTFWGKMIAVIGLITALLGVVGVIGKYSVPSGHVQKDIPYLPYLREFGFRPPLDQRCCVYNEGLCKAWFLTPYASDRNRQQTRFAPLGTECYCVERRGTVQDCP